MSREGKKVDRCPHCGSTYGYYRVTRISGVTEMHYHFDGSDADNTHITDSLRYKENKTAFCSDCYKPIRSIKF